MARAVAAATVADPRAAAEDPNLQTQKAFLVAGELSGKKYGRMDKDKMALAKSSSMRSPYWNPIDVP
jgi:hypothetical protein